LAQQNGFFGQDFIFEQFAEAQQSLTLAREECNKYDMTAALSI